MMPDPYPALPAAQLINAAVLDDDLFLEADVVIIGTGAGGGICAEIFASFGRRVIMIEEGPLKTSADFKMHEKEAYPDLYQESAARKTLDKAITILQGRAVGGSTTVNWTSSFRTPTQTLEHWRDRFGVEGIDSASMAPWFEYAEKRLHIHRWQMPPNPNNARLAEGARRLGWHWDVIARNVFGCIDLGYCGMGCPVNAKQSMLVTTLPAAIRAGAVLISRARVERITHSGGCARGVELIFMDANGQPRPGLTGRVKAALVVLAAGAIGSPAVLLRSKLPDPYQRLGKRTFLHPVNASTAQFDKPIAAWQGAPQSIYSDEFLWPQDERAGFKLEVPPLHPVLVATIVHGYGMEHAQMMAKLPHTQATLALLRDGFSDQSSGGQVELDANGYPHLAYPLTDYLWQGFRRAWLAMAELQFAAGAKKVLVMHRDAQFGRSWAEVRRQINNLPLQPLRPNLFSAHVMGGCGMGADPRYSVVNSEGRHQQIEQLYILDGSIFPTSVGVNPQLSIYAQAARISAQLLSLTADDLVGRLL